MSCNPYLKMLAEIVLSNGNSEEVKLYKKLSSVNSSQIDNLGEVLRNTLPNHDNVIKNVIDSVVNTDQSIAMYLDVPDFRKIVFNTIKKDVSKSLNEDRLMDDFARIIRKNNEDGYISSESESPAKYINGPCRTYYTKNTSHIYSVALDTSQNVLYGEDSELLSKSALITMDVNEFEDFNISLHASRIRIASEILFSTKKYVNYDLISYYLDSQSSGIVSNINKVYSKYAMSSLLNVRYIPKMGTNANYYLTLEKRKNLLDAMTKFNIRNLGIKELFELYSVAIDLGNAGSSNNNITAVFNTVGKSDETELDIENRISRDFINVVVGLISMYVVIDSGVDLRLFDCDIFRRPNPIAENFSSAKRYLDRKQIFESTGKEYRADDMDKDFLLHNANFKSLKRVKELEERSYKIARDKERYVAMIEYFETVMDAYIDELLIIVIPKLSEEEYDLVTKNDVVDMLYLDGPTAVYNDYGDFDMEGSLAVNEHLARNKKIAQEIIDVLIPVTKEFIDEDLFGPDCLLPLQEMIHYLEKFGTRKMIPNIMRMIYFTMDVVARFKDLLEFVSSLSFMKKLDAIRSAEFSYKILKGVSDIRELKYITNTGGIQLFANHICGEEELVSLDIVYRQLYKDFSPMLEFIERELDNFYRTLDSLGIKAIDTMARDYNLEEFNDRIENDYDELVLSRDVAMFLDSRESYNGFLKRDGVFFTYCGQLIHKKGYLVRVLTKENTRLQDLIVRPITDEVLESIEESVKY